MTVLAGLDAAPRQGKFRLGQAIAILGCSIVALMSVAAVGNAALSHVVLPPALAKTAVVAHFALMFATLPLTIAQMALPKGTRLHGDIGYAWCALMIAAAVVSFSVHEIKMPNGALSGPHYVAIFTLVMVPLIVFLARTRHVVSHSRTAVGFVLFALVFGGLFTFIPGRAMGLLFWAIFN